MKQNKNQKRQLKLKKEKKRLETRRHESNRMIKIAKVPDFITCNECGGKAPQSTFEILNTKGMDGIEVAVTGICSDCKLPTIAVSGDPDATAELMMVLQDKMGGGQLGIEQRKLK
ncbi:hypothetical protein [Alteromonas oceanisediminis]|uniref:hypothetical protein n=1 Tax=Alteromonas oceanisediminis TaxID=2836180 RepID=UPI001BDAEB25|nr:hypothetical protein [Alteromonas oceanisediminis]MBT0587962.1 hypothetical protein [Alteromonas oceanisediminis]